MAIMTTDYQTHIDSSVSTVDSVPAAKRQRLSATESKDRYRGMFIARGTSCAELEAKRDSQCDMKKSALQLEHEKWVEQCRVRFEQGKKPLGRTPVHRLKRLGLTEADLPSYCRCVPLPKRDPNLPKRGRGRPRKHSVGSATSRSAERKRKARALAREEKRKRLAVSIQEERLEQHQQDDWQSRSLEQQFSTTNEVDDMMLSGDATTLLETRCSNVHATLDDEEPLFVLPDIGAE